MGTRDRDGYHDRSRRAFEERDYFHASSFHAEEISHVSGSFQDGDSVCRRFPTSASHWSPYSQSSPPYSLYNNSSVFNQYNVFKHSTGQTYRRTNRDRSPTSAYQKESPRPSKNATPTRFPKSIFLNQRRFLTENTKATPITVLSNNSNFSIKTLSSTLTKTRIADCTNSLYNSTLRQRSSHPDVDSILSKLVASAVDSFTIELNTANPTESATNNTTHQSREDKILDTISIVLALHKSTILSETVVYSSLLFSPTLPDLIIHISAQSRQQYISNVQQQYKTLEYQL